MNDFEQKLQTQFGKKILEKIQKVKIGIAGAGGLGSNCAFNLVRSGFKKIKVIDFDKVEISNLNRQFYFFDQLGMDKVEALKVNLLRINPDLAIESVVKKLDQDNILESFADCDVVVEAFDGAEEKAMLAAKFIKTDKFLVSASGLAGIGSSDSIKTNRIKDNFFLIGDLVSDSKNSFPISPRVNVAAAKQADLILEFVVKNTS